MIPDQAPVMREAIRCFSPAAAGLVGASAKAWGTIPSTGQVRVSDRASVDAISQIQGFKMAFERLPALCVQALNQHRHVRKRDFEAERHRLVEGFPPTRAQSVHIVHGVGHRSHGRAVSTRFTLCNRGNGPHGHPSEGTANAMRSDAASLLGLGLSGSQRLRSTINWVTSLQVALALAVLHAATDAAADILSNHYGCRAGSQERPFAREFRSGDCHASALAKQGKCTANGGFARCQIRPTIFRFPQLIQRGCAMVGDSTLPSSPAAKHLPQTGMNSTYEQVELFPHPAD